MNMMPCDLCKRNYKITRSIFPYAGKLGQTCIVCLGKHKLEPDEEEMGMQDTRYFPNAKKYTAQTRKYEEQPSATKADAIKYLLGIK